MALYLFLAKTTSITCLDLEVAGPAFPKITSLALLPSLSQLAELTISTGTHSVEAFRDLVESLSTLERLRTLRLFTYKMVGGRNAKSAAPRSCVRCSSLVLKILLGPRDGDERTSQFASPFYFEDYFVGVTAATLIVPFVVLNIRSETLVDLEIGPGDPHAGGEIYLTTPQLKSLILAGTTIPRTLTLLSDCSLRLLECHFGVQIKQVGGRLEVTHLALHSFFAQPWQTGTPRGVLPCEGLPIENILLRGTAVSLGVVLSRPTPRFSLRFESDILLRLLMEGSQISFEDGLLASPLVVINTYGTSNTQLIQTLFDRCPGTVKVVACGRAAHQENLCRALAKVLPPSSIHRCCDDSSVGRWRGTTNWTY